MKTIIKVPMQQNEIVADLDVEYEWKTATDRSYGVGNLRIPFGHDLVQNNLLPQSTGLTVIIPHGQLGTWTGVQTQRAQRDLEGNVSISLMHISSRMQNMLVEGMVIPQYAPAGLIAQEAFLKSIHDRTRLRAGTFLQSSPLVPTFDLSPRMLSEVYTDLLNKSGQEWEVTEDNTLNWIAPIGRLYERTLTEGADFIILSEEEDTSERVWRVVPFDVLGRRGIPVEAPELRDDPTAKEIAITVNSPSLANVQAEAEARISMSRTPVFRLSIGILPITGTGSGGGGGIFNPGIFSPGILGGSGSGGGSIFAWSDAAVHWANIREGSIIRLIMTSRGLPANYGRHVTARVIARKFGSAFAYPILNVQVIQPWSILTLPAARQVSFPQLTPPTTIQDRLRSGMFAFPRITPNLLSVVPAQIVQGEFGSNQLTGLETEKLIGLLTVNQLGVDSVANPQLQNDSITTPKIGDGQITDPKIVSLSPSKLTGVTAGASDLNKTTVEPWQGGATANPTAAAVTSPADATNKSIDSSIVTGNPAADLAQTVSAINSLVAEVNTINSRFNDLLTRLRSNNIINT